jgi:hypothetical protein
MSIAALYEPEQTQFERNYETVGGEDAGDGSRSREINVPLGQ